MAYSILPEHFLFYFEQNVFEINREIKTEHSFDKPKWIYMFHGSISSGRIETKKR